jgi:hypothetical protein
MLALEVGSAFVQRFAFSNSYSVGLSPILSTIRFMRTEGDESAMTFSAEAAATVVYSPKCLEEVFSEVRIQDRA